MQTIFWLENLKGGEDLKDLGVDGRIIFEWILKLRIVISSGIW
jgi:hypothetical protein